MWPRTLLWRTRCGGYDESMIGLERANDPAGQTEHNFGASCISRLLMRA